MSGSDFLCFLLTVCLSSLKETPPHLCCSFCTPWKLHHLCRAYTKTDVHSALLSSAYPKRSGLSHVCGHRGTSQHCHCLCASITSLSMVLKIRLRSSAGIIPLVMLIYTSCRSGSSCATLLRCLKCQKTLVIWTLAFWCSNVNSCPDLPLLRCVICYQKQHVMLCLHQIVYSSNIHLSPPETGEKRD